jgi:hypothetical protein
MEKIQGFDFFRLHFDENGNLPQQGELHELKQHAAQATDAIYIAHGFRNDEADATGLYARFLQTFRQHVDGDLKESLGSRRFVVAGVYWPSKKFPEQVEMGASTDGLREDLCDKERTRAQLLDLRDTVAGPEQKDDLNRAIVLLDSLKANAAAQDEFVRCVLKLLHDSELDAMEGITKVICKKGSDLLSALKTPIRNPVRRPTVDEGGVAEFGAAIMPPGTTQGPGDIAGGIFGRIGTFLNLTTWYVMKNRSSVVGANGVADAVREVKGSAPVIRVHLAGHSLGGRMMASCCKSLGQDPKVQPDSLTLLQAAFSHYGFSANNGLGQAGFFRSVIEDKVVKGPFLATFSAQDQVVGGVYAIASRLAGQNTAAVGDANDEFGGIGRNGAQKTAEAPLPAGKLHVAGTPYTFSEGQITCLDGSGGLIVNHGDVTNTNIAYAFASAVAATGESLNGSGFELAAAHYEPAGDGQDSDAGRRAPKHREP